MFLGQIIKKYRTENNLTLQAFANKCGLSKGYIAMLEKNYNSKTKEPIVPSAATFCKVADAMKISLEELLEQVDENQPIGINDIVAVNKSTKINNINPITKVKIPLLGDIACGKPIFCNEDRESYVEVGAEIHADFCLRAKGDSMIGARIYDGDIVFIREQSMVENGEIAAVVIDDEATLKRVSYDSSINELRLMAENPNYKTMIFHGEELNQIRILGKAIAFQGDVK